MLSIQTVRTLQAICEVHGQTKRARPTFQGICEVHAQTKRARLLCRGFVRFMP